MCTADAGVKFAIVCAVCVVGKASTVFLMSESACSGGICKGDASVAV